MGFKMPEFAASTLSNEFKMLPPELASKCQVIALNGPPGSGKDTIANAINDHLYHREIPCVRVTIASELKRLVALMLNLDNLPHSYFDQVKNEPRSEFGGRTPREVWIAFSEDFIKPMFGNDFWIRRLFGDVTLHCAVEQAVDRRGHCVIVVTDLGFMEELDFLGKQFDWGSILQVHLYREGCTFDSAKDARRYVQKAWADNAHVRLYNHELKETIRRATRMTDDFVRVPVKEGKVNL